MLPSARELDIALAQVRKVILRVALVVASPFWMLAFLLFLLGKPAMWSILLASIGALVVTMGYVAWLVVRRKMRDVARVVGRAGGLFDPPP